MNSFKIEWNQLKEILSERPKIMEVQLIEPNIKKSFKFIKDKEGKLYDMDDYFERSGSFIIQDVETKKNYSADYYESGGDEDDMQVFGSEFDFEIVKETKKEPKKVIAKPKKKTLDKAPSQQIKFSVSEKEYVAAQRKAFKIWKELLSKEPQWAFDYSLNKNNYVALAENPKPHFYTVCDEPTTINTATGMFRFPNEKVANKFIKMMGTSIKHLCPKIYFS